MRDLTFDIKDYYDRIFARNVRGFLTLEHAALYFDPPEGSVVIWDSLRVEHYTIWPGICKHCGQNQPPEWWTTIYGRVFPDVDPEHQKSVQHFGQKLHDVRIPIVKPLTAVWNEG